MGKSILVTCLFDDADSAVDAIHELRRSGFSDDQLGFVVRYDMDEHATNRHASEIIDNLLERTGIHLLPTPETNRPAQHTIATTNDDSESQSIQEKHDIGIIRGSVIGGTLGTLAALRFPRFGLIVAGGNFAALLAHASPPGLVDNFLSIGIPEKIARYYEQKFQEGCIILIIKDAEQQLQAQDILHYHRAHNIEVL